MAQWSHSRPAVQATREVAAVRERVFTGMVEWTKVQAKPTARRRPELWRLG